MIGKGRKQLKRGYIGIGRIRKHRRKKPPRRSQRVLGCNFVSPPPDSSAPATPQVRERPKLTASAQARRRVSIGHVHSIIGSPALSRSVVKDVALRLNLNYNSGRKAVVRTLGKKMKLQEEIANGTGAHTTYDLGKRSPKVGPKKVLRPVDIRVAADCLQHGFGLRRTAYFVSAFREKSGLKKVWYTTIRNAVEKEMCVRKRQNKKAGNVDVNSAWAIGRLAFAKQLNAQITTRMSGRTAVRSKNLQGGLGGVVQSICLEQIAFWDEKHKKQIIGVESKYDWQVIDPVTGKVTWLDNTRIKFPQEARYAFGVMMKKNGWGFEGVKMAPFNYTGCTVLGSKQYDKKVKEVVGIIGKLKSGEWKKHDKGDVNDGGRFRSRYGDEWLKYAKEETQKRLHVVDVRDMMKHMVDEGNKAFAGTPYADTWVIHHDALSQWHEEGAQKYLRDVLGMTVKRQLCSQGTTNSDNRYKEKSVGNSPELSPLDSNLFADLDNGINQHCAISSIYEKDDKRKFSLGTPKEIQHCVIRTWEVCPTSERIVQDIKRWKDSLKKIIDHQGAVVPDLDNRSGRRAITKITYHKDCDDAISLFEEKWKGWDEGASD